LKTLERLKIVKKKIFIIVLVVCGFIGYNFFPLFVESFKTSRAFAKNHLEIQKIYYDNNFFEFAERGEGETIVFVHGFRGDKTFWIPYSHYLTNYHVIIVDLPGHGKSSHPQDQKYDIYSLEKALDKFIQLKKLKQFHMVGCSMGGGIASIYAYNHPDKVKSLILLNPLGIDTDQKSDFQKKLMNGKNILFPASMQELNVYFIYLLGRDIPLNTYYKKYILKKMLKDEKFYKKVFEELIKSKPIEDELSNIRAKSLIVIGEKDRIIHPSSFEVFVKKIPNIKAVRLEKGSHIFVDQNFNEAIVAIQDFLKE
jgi:abhydrolase domain-containing protein 6